MAALDQTETRNEIARLERQLEDLAGAIERSRKAILASKLAIAGGCVLALAIGLGVVSVKPLAVVVAVAAVFGGIVSFGSNVSTLRQDTAAMRAASATRAELIGRLELRDIGPGSSLTFYQ